MSLKNILNFTTRYSNRYKLPRRFCFSKGTQVTDIAKQTSTSADILLQNLKHANSIPVVLQEVGSHKKIMNIKHSMQALRSIFLLQKEQNSSISNETILKNRNFESLCYSIKLNAGVIDIHETIEALKIVSFLGVNPNSTIVQCLLQLIRHNINNLNLHQIIFLDFVLNHFKRTPMIEALKMALPMVFQINYEKKMDRENMTYLVEFLYYAVKTDLSEKCLTDIIEAIMDCPEPLDVKNAKSILWSLTDLPPSGFIGPLFKRVLDTLVIYMDDVAYTDIKMILNQVTSNYSKRFSFYYDRIFMDSCVNYVIDKDMGFVTAVYVLRKISRVYHHSKYLLDYLSKKVEEDPKLILTADPADIYSIVISIALSEYRPVHWDKMKKLIEEKPHLVAKRKEILWTKFASCLTCLEIFRSDVLNLCLSEESLASAFSKVYMSELIGYLGICHSLQLYRPELESMIPENYNPEKMAHLLKSPSSHPLAGCLNMALGGENYVKTGLLSKIGAYIDHAVVFRHGGYPVAIPSSKVTFIEELPCTDDHNLIVFLGLTENDFTMNNKQMRMTTVLRIKRLEKEGYLVVPIDLDVWMSLPDFEKIPYIMQNVKEKLNVDSISLSVNVG